MIVASEQVLADAPPQGRRRSATVTATRAPKSTLPRRRKSLSIERTFSDPKINPFDQVEWERRTAEITDDAGKVIFKQENVEVPKAWSLLATKVVVSKYFYGEQGTPERETSVRQLIHRICRTIADWGVKDGYFTKADGEVFYDELTWLCLNQYGAFNSPVWFNVGLYHQYHVGNTSSRGNWFCDPKTGQAERAKTQYEYPQCSACFIQSVAGQHGVHHAPGAQRGDALQVRLRHRHRPFAHPLEQGEAQRRRPAQRPAVLPEGL